MRIAHLLVRASAFLLLLGSFTTGQAASVTVFGDDISFTYDDATLFGEVTVVGNTFFFTPDNFFAKSLNGAGVDLVNETLAVDIAVTTGGFEIDTLYLRERGDYRLSGSGSEVSVEGQLSVVSNTTACGDFSCEEIVNFNGGALIVQNALTPWDINETMDLGSVGAWGSDTDISLTLENILRANTVSSPSSEAFIEKKFGGIAISVNVPPAIIPVPAAVWLFGSGLLGLVGVARRKQT